MQPLTGVVIEYLVVGSTSALWILVLLAAYGILPEAVPDSLLVLLVPLLYVLGMLSDRLGRLLIETHKRTIEAPLHKEHNVSTQDVHSRLVASLPALATQLEIRRTRDRIARGVLANVPFLTFALMLRAKVQVQVHRTMVIVAIALGGALLYWAVLSMWRRYQLLSSRYEILCDTRLREISRSRQTPE